MATTQNLLDDCRSHLDEKLTEFWTDDELVRWINEALRDVARRGETLQSVKAYDTVANQVQYDAPLDMLRIYRVEFQQSSNYIVTLEYRDLHGMDDIWYTARQVPGSIPYWYSFWGFPHQNERAQIFIYPATSQALSKALRVFYYRLPAVLQVSQPNQPADINVGWEDLVPLYVEIVARRKSDDPRWQEASTLYEARMALLIQTTRHYSDQENFISGRGGGLGRLPFWLTGGVDDW